MSLANLDNTTDVITIPNLNTDTLQCNGISYSYPSDIPPVPSVNQLGSVVTTTEMVDGNQISGTYITQTAYSLVGISAGTYLLYYNTTLDGVSSDINSYPQIVDSATGATVLAQGNPYYLTGSGSQYSTTNGTFCFTATQDFNATVFWNTGGGGGQGTPQGGGGLTLVRLA
jgi:hypothetical protein